MISSTETIVAGILADLADALGAGNTGCFHAPEVLAVHDKLRAVAARKLSERTYNARARLLLAGLCDVARARDLDAARSCPLASKLQAAIGALRAINLEGS